MDSSMRHTARRTDLFWLIPALLLPSFLCAGIILHGFVAISPTIHSEVCALGFSRCGNLSTCVQQEFVCDGRNDCANGADEDILTCSDNQGYVAVFLQMILEAKFIALDRCDLPVFPDECRCRRSTAVGCVRGNLSEVPAPLHSNTTSLILNDQRITYLNDTAAFRGLTKLNRLYICRNQLAYIAPGVFADLVELQWLRLNDNALRFLERGVLNELFNLRHLELTGNLLTLEAPHHVLQAPPNVYHILLSNNYIASVSQDSFSLTRQAKVIFLADNNVSYIHPRSLESTECLVEIDLRNNKLHDISPGTFQHNRRLSKLTLDNNPLDVATVVSLLEHAQSVTSLSLQGIELEGQSLDSVTTMTNLTYVYFKYHRYCRYARMAHVCTPKGDGISSFANLLQHRMHRICIWLITAVTLLGNLMVIMCRYLWQEESTVHTLFITHLCTADMMTGLFLLVIASYDIILRDEYNRHALWWVTSWACSAAGALGVMAAEVSVMILAFIAFERYMSITFPFRPAMVNYRSARLVMALIWAIGFLLATLPLTSERVFGKFYSTNGVCYPLFLDAPFSSGWEYSCFILLGINFTALAMVCFFYSGMFRSLQKVRVNSRASADRNNLTRRLMAIVFVYFLCLVPVIVTKLLVLLGKEIPVSLYAWLTVFVVPVNSAFNPLVYTLFTPYFCRQFQSYAKNRRPSSVSFVFSSMESYRRDTLFSMMSDTSEVACPQNYTRVENLDTTVTPDRTDDILGRLDDDVFDPITEPIPMETNNVHTTCTMKTDDMDDSMDKMHKE